MAPPLARSAPSELNHWWRQFRFRLQNRKGWKEMLDETFLLQNKRTNGVPLFFAAKENSAGCIKKLLDSASTNIFERGALGETALHVAVMNDNMEAALALMDGAPELINEPMTSDLFLGMTPLHIAVVNQNFNLVRSLIGKGADVATPRVTGLYFRKRRGGLLYYGEHILAFAACVGNQDIISMVINAGASTRAQDSIGNTVLHILVLQPNKAIACLVLDLLLARDVELDQAVPLDMVPNYHGLTPFKLAAKEGNLVVRMDRGIERRGHTWSIGGESTRERCSTLQNTNMIHCNIQYRETDDDLLLQARRILEVTPVRQLVSLKWNLYGKHYFRLLLLLYLLYIGTFTLCCVYRPLKDAPENYTVSDMDKTIRVQKTLKESYVTYGDNLRLAGEMISVLGALVILLLEIPDMLRVGAKHYFGQTALGGPFHVILIAYAFLVVLLCVFRVSGVQGETVVMAVCLVLGWSNVMFFARGFQMLGPYVIMIQKIIFGDLTKFMWLSFIVLIGFSTSLWMVYMTQDPDSLPAYRSFPITLFSQFELSVGLIDLPVDHTITTPPIVHVLHCTFSVVSYILLLNLLTAMMSDTQWRVAQERDELWRTQVVATTLMLERRLPRCLWPRLGVCGLLYGLGERWYLRVEDRNDPLVQKMRRYIQAFSKDEDQSKEREEMEKTDMSKGPGSPVIRPKHRGGIDGNRKSLARWQMIRHSALGLDVEQEEPEDDCYVVII
uniref:Transient receptor potential cation channel, subfamily V, member 6 n=1 Tax=Oncorhynchus kisutch TaxID=8019 RepID=A0A8C7DRD5_ONCKI